MSPRDKNASRDGHAPRRTGLNIGRPAAPAATVTTPRPSTHDNVETPTIAKPRPVSGQNTKSVFIKTYGCQMNVYDSERMADVLAPIGYAAVDKPDEADLVILNTCHIREKAAEKVYSELGRIRKHKETNKPDMKVAVAGCVAQAEGAEIRRRAPVVDMVLGPQTYH